jgi:hypothetical protein
VKYGLTSNLTLDATINPDFGQVEADPAVLNLSAFEQFFEERRPVLPGGRGDLHLPQLVQRHRHGCRGLFYSRRVGRSPQLGGAFGDAPARSTRPSSAPPSSPGARRAASPSGVLDAVTQREQGTLARTIEPATTTSWRAPSRTSATARATWA